MQTLSVLLVMCVVVAAVPVQQPCPNVDITADNIAIYSSCTSARSLQITNQPSMTLVSLPYLQTVDNIDVEDNSNGWPVYLNFELPVLASVYSNFLVKNNQNYLTFNVPSLVTIGNAFTLQDSKINAIYAPSLSFVGAMIMQGYPGLTQFSLPFIRAYVVQINMPNSENLDYIAFPQLTGIDYTLTVTNAPLYHLALPMLYRVQTITIKDNPNPLVLDLSTISQLNSFDIELVAGSQIYSCFPALEASPYNAICPTGPVPWSIAPATPAVASRALHPLQKKLAAAAAAAAAKKEEKVATKPAQPK